MSRPPGRRGGGGSGDGPAGGRRGSRSAGRPVPGPHARGGQEQRGRGGQGSRGRGGSDPGAPSRGRSRTSGRNDAAGRAQAAGRTHDGGGTQVEGRQAVRELLRAGRRRVRQLYIAETADGSGPLGEIVDLADAAGVAVRQVPRERIDAMASTEAPQGVVAIADPLPEADLEDLLRPAPDGSAPFLVVLDGVTDPHNLGAVMRSALCAGATGVVVGRHRAAGLGPAAVKAAAGAVEHLPVATVAGIPAALSDLVAAGVWTVGLDADAAGTLWNLPVATEAVAVVLGAEGRGLSSLVRRRCDVVVGIPLTGPLDSLNVSAAAALACFEVARRRAAAL